MLSIALTGGIGSGKSAVGDILSELGAIVIDSDQLARDVIERGTSGFDEVLARFGDGILVDGEISRAKLAEVIFSNEEARKDLEGIIHPRVRDLSARVLQASPEDSVVVNEIPLLFETQGQNRFDLVITVEADDEIRTKRLLDRGLKAYQIEKRISAQASRSERESIADFVIENSGNLEELEKKVRKIWEFELVPRSKKKND
jgi:dephospho-CoA kinase